MGKLGASEASDREPVTPPGTVGVKVTGTVSLSPGFSGGIDPVSGAPLSSSVPT